MNQPDLQELWETYFPRIYGYFYRRVTNRADVDDLTSIVMTSFIQSQSSKPIDNIEAYLWSIARTQLALFIRNKSKTPVTLEMTTNIEKSDDFETKQMAITLEMRLDRLFQIMDTYLSHEERSIFTLAYQDGYNSTQIGEKLGIKANTIRQKLSRILTKIKPYLSQI
jgi:RNA polymerase sigma factor (sigma-70 family)